MNEKLTIQDLIDLLANKHHMTKKDAEAFVKEFFLLIEEALENEKYVKIKGLGTFKLIGVDGRESVKVNTGERFQIKGHTKVSFTPDASLRDSVNKPFAHFETVLLNNNTILEDTLVDGIDGEEDEIVEETPVQFIEKVNEAKSAIVKEAISEEIMSEVGADPENIQEEVVAENEYVEEVEELIKVPVSIEENQPESECEKQEMPVEDIIQTSELTAEQIIAQELRNVRLKPEFSKELSEDIVTEPIVKNSHKKEKSPVSYLITIIVIVVLLCASAVVFIYYPDLFSSSPNKATIDMPVTTQPVQPEANFSQILDTIESQNTKTEIIPTISGEASEKEQPTPQKEIEASGPTQVYSDSEQYTITGTKGAHTIVAGESLTKVSLRYYGTKAMWPYIVKHNQGVIKNPDNVPYGTTVQIPELTKK